MHDSRLEAKMQRVYRTLEDMVRPAHTALLIIDMQRDYCGDARVALGLDPTPQRQATPVIEDLVRAGRAAGVLPIFVQNVLSGDGSTHSGVAIANELHVWNSFGVSDEASDGSGFVDGIGYQPNDIVVTKRRNSAFFGTDLDLVLRSNAIQTVVLVGQATFACVDTTARDALCHDYYVTVVEDAVATVAEEREFHEASLHVLRHFLPVRGVVRSTELHAVWSKVHAAV
jgi:nicotinamidase-related amidase